MAPSCLSQQQPPSELNNRLGLHNDIMRFFATITVFAMCIATFASAAPAIASRSEAALTVSAAAPEIEAANLFGTVWRRNPDTNVWTGEQVDFMQFSPADYAAADAAGTDNVILEIPTPQYEDAEGKLHDLRVVSPQ